MKKLKDFTPKIFLKIPKQKKEDLQLLFDKTINFDLYKIYFKLKRRLKRKL